MTYVEPEMPSKNIELSERQAEREYPREVEHKLVPQDPKRLEALFSAEAYPITQIYLSSPHDKGSLRVKASYRPEGAVYSAAYKSRGEMSNQALSRHEVETEISQEAFERYVRLDLPTVFKRRANISPGMHVDFYSDPSTLPILEVEHEDADVRATLVEVAQEMTGHTLVDCSDDPSRTNEAIAWQGRELPPAPEKLEAFTRRVLADAVAQYVGGKSSVHISLTGLSGSGKSTVARRLQEEITARYGESMLPTVISTDDYHFGKSHLEATYGAPYTAWDDARTYNLAALAEDITRLNQGTPIAKRHFDFDRQEPILEASYHLPSPFIITEGIHACHPSLEAVSDLRYELPTSVADGIQWDLSRLFNEDRVSDAFPTYASRLRHLLEDTVLRRLEQHTPIKQSFSASMRPMAERAFMLYRL